MHGKCHHIGLFTGNPEKILPFYTEKMGFEQHETKIVSKEWMTRIFGMPAACRLIKMRLGSAVLEIFVPEDGGEKLAPRSFPAPGYNHWALSVKDKRGFVRGLERKGVSVLKLEGTGRFIYFVKDPEGNLIEIYQDQDTE